MENMICYYIETWQNNDVKTKTATAKTKTKTRGQQHCSQLNDVDLYTETTARSSSNVVHAQTSELYNGTIQGNVVLQAPPSSPLANRNI